MIRGAFPEPSFQVSADELAGMACEDEVESRLIQGGDGKEWLLENGPLPESRFGNLPERDWTLLVQAVDIWLPEASDFLDHFNFLPRWRLDDLMVSYAVDGGSVGPHFDMYDVFLIQAKGIRRWKIGQQCDERSPLVEDAPLKLLKHFDTKVEYQLRPGDMLYLPPGVAHWGIAEGECMTYSVGYRSPSTRELINELLTVLVEKENDRLDWPISNSISAAFSNPFVLAFATNENPDEVISDLIIDESVRTLALGRLFSEPKYPGLCVPPEESQAEIETALGSEDAPLLEKNHASRFFYSKVDGETLLFVDGEHFTCSRRLAQVICESVKIDTSEFNESDCEVLVNLILQGSILLP